MSATQIKTKFILDLAVTTAKINTGAVTSDRLANDIALAGIPTASTAASGTNTTQLATTAFVQTAVSAVATGIKPKQAVRAATTVNGTLASSFANGQTIDTVVLVTGDRILIKNQSSAAANGIYTVNASGAPTRAVDFDQTVNPDEINGSWVAVQEGSQAGYTFVQFGTVATVGTDPINFEYWNPIAGLSAGNGISISGATVSVNLAGTSGLTFSSTALLIKLEASNPTLQIDGSNQLGIKLNGSGAITTGASGIGVATDATTIEINSNALRVKDLGITNAKIANATIDLTAKVTGILPVANGGTGANTLTANSILVGAGTSAVTFIAPGSSGNVLTSNGTTWTSAAPVPTYTWAKEKFTLSGTDITNGYVDLARVVQTASIIAFIERLAMLDTDDYTTSTVSSKTRITFAGSLVTGQQEALVAGDLLYFTYQY